MTERAAKIVEDLHAEDLRACMATFQLARNSTLRKMLFYFLGAVILGIVLSTDPTEARQLLAGSRLCQELLQAAQAARRQQIIALIEPDFALLAIEGTTTPLREFRLQRGIDATVKRCGDYLRGTIAKATSLAAALS